MDKNTTLQPGSVTRVYGEFIAEVPSGYTAKLFNLEGVVGAVAAHPNLPALIIRDLSSPGAAWEEILP